MSIMCIIKQMSSEKLAHGISILFGPVWVPIFVLLLVFNTRLTAQQITILLPALLLLEVIVPNVYVFYLVRTKKASGWNLAKREERYGVLKLMIVGTILSLFLIYFFGNEFLFKLSLINFLVLMTLAIITRFWKISLHMGVNILVITIINFLFHWQMLYLYLVLPLVYWARRKLTIHTHEQLIGGLVLTFVLVFGALHLFGYI